jgi:hypothetical protein
VRSIGAFTRTYESPPLTDVLMKYDGVMPTRSYSTYRNDQETGAALLAAGDPPLAT